MKKYWYLVASLPYLRLGEKPVLDADGFRAACMTELSSTDLDTVDAVLGNREPPAGAAGILWNAEVQLRDALIRLRAKHHTGENLMQSHPFSGFSVALEKSVQDAFARSNPAEMEMELDRVRWNLADELAATDPFGFPAVVAYAAKLRLATRWMQMNDEKGIVAVEKFIAKSLTEDRDGHKGGEDA
ncbi:MAG: DUF2764 family protein [Kiritimatiellales bacterium]